MENCFGVDGCPGGWLLVGLGPGGVCGPRFASRFTEVLAYVGGGGLIFVDIPIGLPDARQIERRCDVEARQALGKRGCTIFPAPVREVLDLAESCKHREASDCQRELTGRGLSIQAHCLFPKIREVDGVMRLEPQVQGWVRESHPELCFASLNGGRPVYLPKRSKAGFEQRLGVLRRYLPGVDAVVSGYHRRRGPGGPAADDVLDAAVLAVNAWLGARQGFKTFPTEGVELDRYGLRMEMVTAPWG